VQVPGGDQTSVKRTAQFFINSFYERLENTQVCDAAVERRTPDDDPREWGGTAGVLVSGAS
jgi:hypothetical protein